MEHNTNSYVPAPIWRRFKDHAKGLYETYKQYKFDLLPKAIATNDEDWCNDLINHMWKILDNIADCYEVLTGIFLTQDSILILLKEMFD